MTRESSPGFRGNKPRATRELAAWHAVASAPEALEPGLPIVDAHHHLYGSAQDEDYYLLDNLLQDLNCGHRVVGTVYVEAYRSGWRTSGPKALQPVGETEMIVAAAARPLQTRAGDCAVAAAIVCYADMALGDAVEGVLQQHLEAGQGRVRSVRQRAATVAGPLGDLAANKHKPYMLQQPAVRRGIAHLAPLGLAFDTWVYHTQLDDVLDLADRFPGTTIVLNHVGGPLGVMEFASRGSEVRRTWEAGLRALAARPNVHVKIGGLGMPVLGFGFEHGAQPPAAEALAKAWSPLIETCGATFGTRRCMFESNFPVDKQSCSYSALWNAYKLATQSWSSTERSDLFYRTACTAYRLPELLVQCEALAANLPFNP